MDNVSIGRKKPTTHSGSEAQLPCPLILLIERARSVTTDRILRMPSMRKKTGRAPPTIWDDVSEGIFPTPIKIGPRAVGWRESEVDAWIECKSFATRCADIPFDMRTFIAALTAPKVGVVSIGTCPQELAEGYSVTHARSINTAVCRDEDAQ